MTISGIFNRLGIAAIAAMLPMAASTAAEAAPTIQFGAPTWPGVTVKTEVATQLMEEMGYSTNQRQASPAFIINSLKKGDLNVYLGGWIPAERDLIRPAEKDGEVDVLTSNISGALMTIAVPEYVWDAGVHTVADLDKYADKFDHKIYGIEQGSGFNGDVKEAIANDDRGLGDWKLIPSTTSAMLSQVGRKIERNEWVAFLGWKPHWMNIEYDMKYPKAEKGEYIGGGTSDVLTVVDPEFKDSHPELADFLEQYVVTNDEQSEWVFQNTQKEREPEKIATEWIGNHLDRVGEWLDGVETRDGKPAIEAVRAEYSD